jgi:hypothetical protein
MPNLSVILAATLTVSDTTLSPSPQIINRSVNNITLNGATGVTECLYVPFLQAISTGTAVPLAGATVWLLYVKNLAATGNLTLAYTPAGGASQNAPAILPGGVFLYMQPAESAGGITAATLTASSGTVSAEVMSGY